jgi:hypothetical protein
MRDAAPSPDDEDAFVGIDNALTRAEEAAAEAEAIRPAPRRTALLTVLFAFGVILLAGVIAYTSAVIAVDRAGQHTDERIGVLERDLQQRREAAAAQNAARDAQLAEFRRLLCLFADHAQPRDAAVESVRAQYGCTGGTPIPTASPSRPAAGGPTNTITTYRPGGGRGGGAGQQPTPGVAPQPPATTPPPPPLTFPPQPVPPPPATGGGGLVCVDLPLLPAICV